MTLSDLEWPFHASRAISAVAELLVTNPSHHAKLLPTGLSLVDSLASFWFRICSSVSSLARDAFTRTNRRAIVMMFVCLSVRLSVCLSVCLPGTGVHCAHSVPLVICGTLSWLWVSFWAHNSIVSSYRVVFLWHEQYATALDRTKNAKMKTAYKLSQKMDLTDCEGRRSEAVSGRWSIKKTI